MGKKNTYTEYSYTLKEVDDMEKEYHSKITDLEAKLAESRQQVNDWKQRYESSEERCKQFTANEVKVIGIKDEKIDQLKQQLAEKEKDVQKWKNKKVKYIVDNIICDRNQTAIAELEKVKELAETLLCQFCQSWEYQQRAFRGHRHIEYYDLIKGIDQQIKELKGEK